jgi:gas vesicle protein
MKTGKVILAVLAGIATGASLGVLLAPAKGSDTRKRVSKKGEDLVARLNDKIDEKFDELCTTVTGKAKRTTAQNDSPIHKTER